MSPPNTDEIRALRQQIDSGEVLLINALPRIATLEHWQRDRRHELSDFSTRNKHLEAHMDQAIT